MALNNTYFESNKVYEPLPIPEAPSYVPPVVPTPPDPDPGSVPDIPRPTLTGNVTCSLYINSSDKNVIHKDNYLTELMPTVITIKEVTSIVRPEIYIKTSENILNANYMKLDNYYYYITVDLVPGSDGSGALYKINGVRDALTSFKEKILQLDVIVDKNEYDVNPYLDDGSYLVEERQKIETLPFNLGFNDNGSYILITAGGA